MLSTLQTYIRKYRSIKQGSIAARAKFNVFVGGVVIASFFSLISLFVIRSIEFDRINNEVNNLLLSVESSVRIVCLAENATLASAISSDLLKNPTIVSVRISSSKNLLAEAHKNGYENLSLNEHNLILKKITSPFHDAPDVGSIEIVTDTGSIGWIAGNYAILMASTLFLILLVAAYLLALVISIRVIRPITQFSEEMRNRKPDSFTHLSPPFEFAQNEIGRLSEDINALIDRIILLNTQNHQMTNQIQRTESRMRVLVENAAIGIFNINGQGDILSCNPAFFTILHIPESRKTIPTALNLSSLIPSNEKMISEMIHRVQTEKIQKKEDFELVSRISKTSSWIQIILAPEEDGSLQGLIHDITENKKKESAVMSLTERDSLTEAYNRRGMQKRLNAAFSNYRNNHDLAFAVMLLDLDWFKEVNDSFGHEAGDLVLCIVTRRLEGILREEDTISRLGGDEFLLILPTIKKVDWAVHLGERIINTIRNEIDIGDGRKVKIGVSIGIAISTPNDVGSENLLRRADSAMYAAKKAGKCQLSIAD